MPHRLSLKRVNVLQVEFGPCWYILSADREIEIEVYNIFLIDLSRQTGTEVKLFHQRVRDAHAVGAVIGDLAPGQDLAIRRAIANKC